MTALKINPAKLPDRGAPTRDCRPKPWTIPDDVKVIKVESKAMQTTHEAWKKKQAVHNKPWDSDDYVISHADAGNENFIRLLKIHKDTEMPYARILRYANIGQHDKSSRSRMMTGELTFTEDHCRVVLATKEYADEILEALCYTQKPNEAFYTAVKIIINTAGYNHSTMLAKCRECRQSYAQMSKLEDQLKEFTRVYNHKKKGTKIYFEDYMRNRGYNARNYDNNVKLHEDKSRNVSTLKKSAVMPET